MLENFDFLDVALVSITLLCICGLLFCHPIPDTALFLKETAGAGMVALGFKKAPSTIRV